MAPKPIGISPALAARFERPDAAERMGQILIGMLAVLRLEPVRREGRCQKKRAEEAE